MTYRPPSNLTNGRRRHAWCIRPRLPPIASTSVPMAMFAPTTKPMMATIMLTTLPRSLKLQRQVQATVGGTALTVSARSRSSSAARMPNRIVRIQESWGLALTNETRVCWRRPRLRAVACPPYSRSHPDPARRLVQYHSRFVQYHIRPVGLAPRAWRRVCRHLQHGRRPEASHA
jgi:hypothetical protein